MGQCSTLPAEGRTAQTSKRNEGVVPERNGASFRQKDKPTHRSHHQGKKIVSHSQAKTTSAHIHVESQAKRATNGADALQSRNPDTQVSYGPDPMDEDPQERDSTPPPPASATRTRCYKLNLDSDINPRISSYLGPFHETPPPLTFSSSDDSSTSTSPIQIAIQTAKIFRGITVGKDGTILSQNARATRSNRGAKTKKGEKSRQATKIEKAKDLVEETIRTGKAPESDEAANMMSLVTIGEYDDMKYLVRDGSKRLREAFEMHESELLVCNRQRGGPGVGQDSGNDMAGARKRVSPNYAVNHRANTATSLSSKSGLPQTSPPKLKSHPRDRPSMRKFTEDKTRIRDYSPRAQSVSERNRKGVANSPNDADWGNLSFSRGFHSIWNCGGAGEDTRTTSPTQMAGTKDGKAAHSVEVAANTFRPVFEGRDSNYAQTREAGITARAN